MQAHIPATLLEKDKGEQFVNWLRSLPLDMEDKLTLFRLWADTVGVRITGNMTAKISQK